MLRTGHFVQISFQAPALTPLILSLFTVSAYLLPERLQIDVSSWTFRTACLWAKSIFDEEGTLEPCIFSNCIYIDRTIASFCHCHWDWLSCSFISKQHHLVCLFNLNKEKRGWQTFSTYAAWLCLKSIYNIRAHCQGCLMLSSLPWEKDQNTTCKHNLSNQVFLTLLQCLFRSGTLLSNSQEGRFSPTVKRAGSDQAS